MLAFAVLHRDEGGQLFGQAAAQGAREAAGALPRIAAGDGDHQQARDHALLQLVDQHLLLGRRLAGRKKDMSAEKWLFQTTMAPASMASSQIVRRAGRPGASFGVDRSMLSTERSPSACRYSMTRTWFLLPLTVMRCTRLAIFWSLGAA